MLSALPVLVVVVMLSSVCSFENERGRRVEEGSEVGCVGLGYRVSTETIINAIVVKERPLGRARYM